MPDALQLLREDHNKVKDLFQRFEKTEDRRQKQQIAQEALMELKVHAQIEEEVFYPAMREQLGDVELLHEAEEEHHVAELLIEELESMRLDDKTFDAKFTVLAENVKHHIGEEEGEMFPKAAEAGRQTLMETGEELQMRKMELMQEMQGGGRRRSAAKGSRNGQSGSRAGRTTRAAAGLGGATAGRKRAGAASKTRGGSAAKKSGSRTGSSSRAASSKRATGTRSTSASKKRSTSARGTKSMSASKSAASRGTKTTRGRSSTGGASRARNTSSKRASAKRGTGSRR